jgi:hypothetical protein
VVAGVGATAKQCEDGGPCAGKGSEAGAGGEGGGFGEPVGSAGNKGPGGGASGRPGMNGVTFSENVFGPSNGTPPEEAKVIPPTKTTGNSPSGSSRAVQA